MYLSGKPSMITYTFFFFPLFLFPCQPLFLSFLSYSDVYSSVHNLNHNKQAIYRLLSFCFHIIFIKNKLKCANYVT